MPPGVSIIVPARNEERSLGRCLDSLLAQDYPDFELIVVDDQSTDCTADLIASRTNQDSRIRSLRVTSLPDGWTGKNYALARGVCEAQGEWLLFTDADTDHAPHALRENLAFAQRHHIDMLSMTPDQECVSVWEKLLQPTIFETLSHWFSYRRINDQRDEQAAGNGQYIMIRRSLYDSIGGHEGIKGCILEDVELARRAKRAGGKLWFAPAQGKIRVRMYHTFAEIWNGWAKNLYLLQGRSMRGLLRTSARITLLDVAPATVLILGTWYGIHAGLLAIAGMMLMVRWAKLHRRWRELGFDTHYAPLHPLGSGIFIGLLWYSAMRHEGGFGIAWKGRQCKEPT
ncbi:MAG TPA: glycosyltransferase [Nitrospirales bacterium]|nr:glycosyltransferase [Nitrospirales bacterium]HIO21476.1 glycosyltransferase [Nitrospirales bacterium]